MALLISAFPAVGCARRPPYELHTLRSGKQVKILGVGRIYAHKEGGWAIVLKYETDLDITNTPALRSEVMEIWQEFRVNADKSGLRLASVNANEPPKGMFITTNRSHGFVFTKSDNGEWRPLD